MEIKIETSCKEDIEKVVYSMTNFCKENFRQSKLFIDGELKHEHDWRSKDEKTNTKTN